MSRYKCITGVQVEDAWLKKDVAEAENINDILRTVRDFGQLVAEKEYVIIEDNEVVVRMRLVCRADFYAKVYEEDGA